MAYELQADVGSGSAIVGVLVRIKTMESLGGKRPACRMRPVYLMGSGAVSAATSRRSVSRNESTAQHQGCADHDQPSFEHAVTSSDDVHVGTKHIGFEPSWPCRA